MAVRQLIFCIDPETGLNNMLSWDGLAADGNEDDMGITCAYFPRTKGPVLNVLQDELLIGGINLGAMWRTLIATESQDDGEDFTAVGIMNNLDPDKGRKGVSDTKRFVKAEFPRINPLTKTGVVIDFCKDQVRPEEGSPTYATLDTVSGSTMAGFPSGIARSINLRIRDTGNANNGEAIFDGFVLHYYPLQTRKEA